jgi:hypothetical protein
MKKVFVISVLMMIVGLALQSCGPEDTHGPKIYILNPDGKILHGEAKDTTLLLWSKYVDPGVFVEDNASKTEDIVVTLDTTVLPLNKEGYLRATRGTVEEMLNLTYTATDLAGNVSTNVRPFRVANVSEVFAGSYLISRTAMHVNDTNYTSTISADARVAGRLRFNKVYAHRWSGKNTYFKVNADLYSSELSPASFDERYGYLCKKGDPGVCYYSGLTYTPAKEGIYDYYYLKIDAQNYEDSLDNVVYIRGIEDANDLPLSKIEFLGDTRTITKIILELNVTKNGQVDKVKEVYIPR